MKPIRLILPACLITVSLLTYGCDQHSHSHGDHDHDHDHDHDAHHDEGEKDHDPGEKHDGDEHAEHGHDHGHSHEHGHDHDHSPARKGPNGGKLFFSLEPHAEFLVTKDRKVQITFVDDSDKIIPVTDQTVNVIAGDRANPTKLTFTKSGDVLLSDAPLPDGDNFPAVVQFKPSPDAKVVIERLNVSLSDYPASNPQ
ncbi:MAG: hypothetical protein AAGD22_14740 [Verrucomicrobiota bacterium]